ncbi:MAG TPA: hypothetical protein VFK02_12385 [Kofleriaceae bacterium]|nr:hypothetical protein [Kofleriaceae bacterium]
MAIDYVLAMGCEPQKLLGVERLVVLHRTRILARTALAHVRDEGDPRSPDEIEVQLTTRKPDGQSARGVTLQTLLDESAPLDEVASHCATCPAGLSREFACHRRIRYPIPEHVEAWLMSRLPSTLDCTAGTLLARGLGEFGWDGAPAARLRAAGTTYFESRAPYGVRWQDDNGTIEISSDQLFQMMFMVGNLAPTHCLMLVLFCGVLPHDISIYDLKDAAGRNRALASVILPTDPDADIEQLAAFLRTLAVAARLDVSVLIDG